MLLRLGENSSSRIALPTIGKKRGAYALALTSMGSPADGCHGQVHLFRMRLQAGRNGVKPDRQRTQLIYKLLRLKTHFGEFREDIHIIPVRVFTGEILGQHSY